MIQYPGPGQVALTDQGRALTSDIDAPLTTEDLTIAFLPSAHIAQRVVVELVPIRQGTCVVWKGAADSGKTIQFITR